LPDAALQALDERRHGGTDEIVAQGRDYGLAVAFGVVLQIVAQFSGGGLDAIAELGQGLASQGRDMLLDDIQKGLVDPAVVLAATDGHAELPTGIERLAEGLPDVGGQIRIFGDRDAGEVALGVLQPNAPLWHPLAAEVGIEKVAEIGADLADEARGTWGI
jgi:hypothetical protein